MKLRYLASPALLAFSLMLVTPLFASAETVFLPSDVHDYATYHFRAEESPYVFDGYYYFYQNHLTFDPGVVIKLKTATSSVVIHGFTTIENRATREEPVYFTSYKDDEHGGDTNGDGDASAPAPGDWGSLYFTNLDQSGDISFFRIYYGGAEKAGRERQYALGTGYVRAQGWDYAEFTLANIEVAHNLNGLYVVNSGYGVAVTSASIHDNVNYGADAYTTTDWRGTPWVSETSFPGNWWGSASGPRSDDNPAGEGDIVRSPFPATPFLAEDPLAAEPHYEECCSSVVFLPGIKGSVLESGGRTLWPPSIWSEDVPRLALDESGESVNDVRVAGVLNTFYGTDIYGPFGSFLDGMVADGTIREWMPLAYDWRYSPEKVIAEGVRREDGSTEDIVADIESAAQRSRTGKVALVAHSMGGLLGKAIIKELEARGDDGIVDAFVLVASPQLGTPQAIASMLHGDDEGILGGIIVRPAAARALSRNLPSAYNLLPSPTYFDGVPDPAVSFDESAAFTDAWRSYWGASLGSYSSFFQFASGAGVLRERPEWSLLRVPEVLRPELLTDAMHFHEEYDAYRIPEHIRVVQVAGWGRPTLKGITYTAVHTGPVLNPVPTYTVQFTREGDGTVVYPSAVAAEADETYFFNLFDYNDVSESDSQHRDILNTNPIQALVRQVVDGEQVAHAPFVSSGKPNTADVDEELVVSTYSPVLLGAYDEQGNFTGVNPGQDLGGDILTIAEGIPGSSFVYTNESQHIFLPKEGVYRFVYEGVGEGPTTVSVATWSGGSPSEVARFSDMPTLTGTSASFTVRAEVPEETEIALDVEGDGETEIVLPDGATPSLSELLASLRARIETLSAKDKVKRSLLQRVASLEKKIAKKTARNATLLSNFKERLSQLSARGKIDEGSAAQVIALLEELEADVGTIPLDPVALASLRESVEALTLKQSQKNNLLKRIDRLASVQALTRALANFADRIEKKNVNGRLGDEDAQDLLLLINQIESAV